jgi:hypothetical protein
MSFTTGAIRANPYVLEIIETGQGQTSVSGIDLEARVAALEAAVASLQAIITATTGVVIGPNSATFTNAAETGDYNVIINGNLLVTGTVTAPS